MTYPQIITAINNYIAQEGGIYSSWYVGITNDPKTRLFNNHNVLEKSGVWIYAPADNENIARNVEKNFLNRGCDGGGGGGGNTSYHVYAYKKMIYTNP